MEQRRAVRRRPLFHVEHLCFGGPGGVGAGARFWVLGAPAPYGYLVWKGFLAVGRERGLCQGWEARAMFHVEQCVSSFGVLFWCGESGVPRGTVATRPVFTGGAGSVG